MYRLNKNYLILIFIILLGLFLRLYQLDKFPVNLSHDEISQLYDAISIAQTGKDIYGNFMPTIFESVHDFKPPFYTYITSIFYLLFGGGEITIRLPGVFFGTLIIPAVFLFVLKLLKNMKIALWAAFFTAIAPFEIFFSRKSFENGAGIFLMLIGFSFLLIYTEKKSKLACLYLSALSFAAGMYTYFSHAIIIPLLLAFFVIIFRKEFNFSKKLFFPTVFFFLLVIPLGLIILTNQGSRYRSQTVFILQDPILGQQIEIAEKSSFLPSFFKYKTILSYAFSRYLNQFDPMYLFGNGLDFTNQGPLGIGPLYLFQLPILILGIYYLIKLKGFSNRKKFIIGWIVLGMLPSGLTFEEHSPHRSVMVFTMFNIVSAVGIYYLLEKIYLKKKLNKLPIFLSFIFILILSFVYFVQMYTINYPSEKSEAIQYPFKQIAQYAWSEYPNYDQIVFDPLYGSVAPTIGTAVHYYLAYYGNYPPAKFQKEYRRGKKEREVIFDKFSIRKVDWREDYTLKKTLIIASSWSLPIDTIDKSRIKKVFYYYNSKNGKVAFYAIGM